MNPRDIVTVLEALQYIAVVLGTIFAVFQYTASKKARRQEKAADVMLRYRDTVIKIGMIEAAIETNASIMEIINKIDSSLPLSFALYEHRKYGISENDEHKYKTFFEETNILKMQARINDEKVSFPDLFPGHLRDGLPKSCSLGQFTGMTLNDVEHLCMEIESGVVDDVYVYGALHQTLLPFIHKTAILMQSMNKASLPDENYYAYTRKLYTRWVIRQTKNYKKMERRLKAKSKR